MNDDPSCDHVVSSSVSSCHDVCSCDVCLLRRVIDVDLWTNVCVSDHHDVSSAVSPA